MFFFSNRNFVFKFCLSELTLVHLQFWDFESDFGAKNVFCSSATCCTHFKIGTFEKNVLNCIKMEKKTANRNSLSITTWNLPKTDNLETIGGKTMSEKSAWMKILNVKVTISVCTDTQN